MPLIVLMWIFSVWGACVCMNCFRWLCSACIMSGVVIYLAIGIALCCDLEYSSIACSSVSISCGSVNSIVVSGLSFFLCARS